MAEPTEVKIVGLGDGKGGGDKATKSPNVYGSNQYSRAAYPDAPTRLPDPPNNLSRGARKQYTRAQNIVLELEHIAGQKWNMLAQEAERTGRLTDLANVAGASAALSRDGLSPEAALQMEYVLEGNEGGALRRREMQLRQELDEMKRPRQSRWSLLPGVGGILAGIAVLALTIATGGGFWAIVGAAVGAAALGGGGIWRTVATRNGVARNAAAIPNWAGYTDNALQVPYEQIETPAQAQARVIEGMRAIAGAPAGGGAIVAANQITDLDDEAKIRAIGDVLKQQASDLNGTRSPSQRGVQPGTPTPVPGR